MLKNNNVSYTIGYDEKLCDYDAFVSYHKKDNRTELYISRGFTTQYDIENEQHEYIIIDDSGRFFVETYDYEQTFGKFCNYESVFYAVDKNSIKLSANFDTKYAVPNMHN